ncbi:hypothetical protein N7539_002925 [Penicillium diatomitis]|uniref:CENP-V/GFA domain-containing protein n=1 Tax=Penicillium diatomitis TaxID=2819901 RepID=A0A9W9XG85_9EURO|nr:uncharacterized protein N7539_002925 [Penicillium diatomitis]KAJ5491358.1 hypothetical protein N7539_002925 [Penicillium diatomitis]
MIHEPLHGSCSCGRNEYTIQVPEDVADHAQVYFDTGRDSRQVLTSWLRVPLEWYQSHTVSFFPDETHTSIRRVFTPHNAPQTRRIFCGFCGTPLTFWTEEPDDEADFMSVSIESLSREHQRALDDLGLLPDFEEEEEDDDEEVDEPKTKMARTSVNEAESDDRPSTIVIPSRQKTDLSRSQNRGIINGIPWFEELVEGSQLGRLIRQRRGVGISPDQSTSIEWEITEVQEGDVGESVNSSDDSNSLSTGKRKREREAETESLPKRP